MANKTYVELVNSAILESGADLASYSTSGSDFTTNTDSLMRRFKNWVARAWKNIQQDADDWHFLTSRGVVNVGPRIMFYTDALIPGSIDATVDIYNSDDEVKVSGLSIVDMVDLTDGYSSESPTVSYGYLTIGPDSFPVGFNLKPGNDYFYLEGRLYELYVTPGPTFTFFQHGAFVGQKLSILMRPRSTQPDFTLLNEVATLTFLDPDTSDTTLGTQGFKMTTRDTSLIDMINGGDYEIIVYNQALDPNLTYSNAPSGQVADFSDDSFIGSGGVAIDSQVSAKAYIHSWGSYDWNEELSDNDFTDLVKEVNTGTYKIIRTSTADAGAEEPLVCVPWQQFLERISSAAHVPGDPVFISKDSQGRWRLWPEPRERVTLTFDYARRPQVLDNYSDVPQHLDEEYEDLIMWKAVMAFGEFDEQPSLVRRAYKEYMNIKYRFEKNKRPVFNFQPKGFGNRHN